jgi:hypothetical protein
MSEGSRLKAFAWHHMGKQAEARKLLEGVLQWYAAPGHRSQLSDNHDVARIFDPLFTKKSDGMGMGPSICRSIIEAHNGEIWFSQNQPQSAVFQFVLPADNALSAST